MKSSEQLNEIAAALSAAQGELTDAWRAQQGYGYKYADIAGYLQIARPTLARHGLAIVQEVVPIGTDSVQATTRILHSSGQWIETDSPPLEVEIKKNLSRAQCIGMVMTYARRYSLAAALGMASEDDDASKPAESAPQIASERLSREQAATLHSLCKQADVSIESILGWLKVESAAQIPASRYEQIVKRLDEIIRKAGGEK